MNMRKNNKGFTLIELIATIAIISLVFGIASYYAIKTINSSKEKETQISLAGIKKSANLYVQEYSETITWKTEQNESTQFSTTCISLNDLVNTGYLKKDQVEKIENADYIILTNNSNNTIIKEELDTGGTCGIINKRVPMPLSKDYCIQPEYNGNEQQLAHIPGEKNNVTKKNGITIENTSNKQVNAGDYQVTLKLEEGYSWKDGTTEDKKITCTITKKTPTLTINSAGGIGTVGKPTTVTLTSEVKGTIASKSSNAKHAKAIIEDSRIDANKEKQIKIETLSTRKETTIISITLTPTDTKNYYTTTTTYTVGEITREKIQKPTAGEYCKNLTYNGKEQTLVEQPTSNGFAFLNPKGKEVGTYKITAELKYGYTWTDDTTENVEIECEIKEVHAPTPTISVADNNTFNFCVSLTGAKACYVSTSSAKPNPGPAQSGFDLNKWTTATSTGDLELSSGQTYYVWSEHEASASGVVSASSATIAVRKVVKIAAGEGTTLTTKHNSSSGETFTGTIYVLHGSKINVTGTLLTGYHDLVLKNGSNTIRAGDQIITANASFSSSATETPIPTISVVDNNTFNFCVSLTGAKACYVSTSSAKPNPGPAQSGFDLNKWTTATSTGDLELSSGQTYYVWSEHEASASGVVSASSATIAVRKVVKIAAGEGTTLTTKHNSSSGETFTGTIYVLHGSKINVTGTLLTGYHDLVLKNESNTIRAGDQIITANASFSSSATKTPTPEIQVEDNDTFSFCKSLTGTSACYVSTSRAKPNPGTAQPNFKLDKWTTAKSTKDLTLSPNQIYYVWSEHEASASGVVSASSATIAVRDVVKGTQGIGTTLTTKHNSSSGETFTGTIYVLHGSKVNVTGELSTGYQDLVLKNGSNTINAGDQIITANANFTSSATKTPDIPHASIPNITVIDHDTFNYNATGAAAYYVNTNATKPSSGPAQTKFELGKWTTATSTGDLNLKSGQTYYVWAENIASTTGVVSTNSATIVVRTVTRTQGAGTTLTTKYDSTSGTVFTNTAYVLNGSKVNVTGVLSTGYNTLVLKNGSNTISAGDQIITANASFTSSATANTYTIKFDRNGGTTGTMSDLSMTYGTAKNLTQNSFTRTGYTFVGWNTQANGSGTNYNDKQSVNNLTSTNGGIVTLYAKWTANTYTITYVMNGGGNPNLKPESAKYDEVVSIGATTSPTKTVTVTGQTNGTGATVGSATSSSQTFAGWTSSTLGSNAKTGTSSTAVSTSWTGGRTTNKYFKNLRNSGTVTMTANWTPVAVNLPTLSKTGYTCNWYTASSGGTLMGAGGASWTPSATSPSSVTAYARCTKNTYTVTFDRNFLASDVYKMRSIDPNNYNMYPANIVRSKTTTSDVGVKGGTIINFTMNSSTTTGGVYISPSTKLEANQMYTWSVYLKSNTNKTLSIGSEQGGKKNVDVTTSWQRFTYTFPANNSNSYAFVFYANSWNSGEILYMHSLELSKTNSLNTTTTTGTYGNNLSLPTDPTRTGYTFDGWYTSPTGGTKITSSNTIPANNTTTYYAHWKVKNYSITYDLNNGSQPNPANPTSYTIGTPTITLNTPMRAGYNFLGWVKSNDVSTGLDSKTRDNPITCDGRDCTFGNSFNVTPGTTYRVFISAKKTQGDLEMQGGLWYTEFTSGNSFDGFGGAFTKYNKENENGWAMYYKDITVPNGKSKAKAYIQLNQSDDENTTTRTEWKIAEVHVIKTGSVQIPRGSTGDKIYKANWQNRCSESTPNECPSVYACGTNNHTPWADAKTALYLYLNKVGTNDMDNVAYYNNELKLIETISPNYYRVYYKNNFYYLYQKCVSYTTGTIGGTINCPTCLDPK